MESFLNHIRLEGLLQAQRLEGLCREKKSLAEQWLCEKQGLPKQIADLAETVINYEYLRRAWEDFTGTETWQARFDMYGAVKDIEGNFIGPKSYLRIRVYNPLNPHANMEGIYEGVDKSEYSKETGLLEKASIGIEITMKSNRPFSTFAATLKSMVAHELLHAYEDYQRQKRRSEEGENPRTPSLWDSLKGNYVGSGDESMRYLLYLTNPTEQNAFIGQAIFDIRKLLKILQKTGKLDDVVNVRSLDTFLKMAHFWPAYEDIRDWIENMQWDRLPRHAQDRFLNQYRTITGKGTETYKQMLHQLRRKWNDFDDKLKSQIGKAVAEFLTPRYPIDTFTTGNKLSESIFYQAF